MRILFAIAVALTLAVASHADEPLAPHETTACLMADAALAADEDLATAYEWLHSQHGHREGILFTMQELSLHYIRLCRIEDLKDLLRRIHRAYIAEPDASP